MNKILPNQTVNTEEGSEGTESLSRRELLMGVVASAVFGVSSLGREALADEVKVAENLVPGPQVAVATVNDANITTGSINRQQTELEKSGYGTYESIVNEFLKTNDSEIITFVRRECEAYLITLPEADRKKAARRVMANMKDLFGYANTPDMPSQSTIDFFVQNTPQMIVEFARYPDKYPNLASKGKLLIAVIKNQKADEGLKKADEGLKKADEGLKKADEGLKKADEGLKKATQDLERAKELNKKLGGKG